MNEAHGGEPHIVPQKVFLAVFIALLFLTFITILVAKAPMFDFGGNINIVLAMLIASVKAGVVALYFMHLKYENPLTWLYVFFPLFLLFILIGGIFIDNPYREVPGVESEMYEMLEPTTADNHSHE